MATQHDIMARGFFPRELPPCFTSVEFADAVTTAGPRPRGVPPVPNDFRQFNSTTTVPRHSQTGLYNMMRPGGIRRTLGIPNPVHFSRLAHFIGSNWANLQIAAHRSTVSLTRPVDTNPGRAITPEIGFHEIAARRAHARRLSRFILKTDIQRFYPSVYTHSLPWALHGKQATKQAFRTGGAALRALYGSFYDDHHQHMNDQQTLGIPIGPDTSLLAAEVILGAVDEELTRRIGTLTGTRSIDDYELGFNTVAEAESARAALQEILSEYELALHPHKTRILTLPEPLDPVWKSYLRVFQFRYAAGTGQRNDLTAYFDQVFDFANRNPEDGTLKYAIPRLNGINVDQGNWDLLQSILIQCVQVEPASLPKAVDQVMHYHLTAGFPVDSGAWEAAMNQLIQVHLPLGHHSEACWAMYLMYRLGLNLAAQSEAVIARCEESTTVLMALVLADRGLANMANMTALHALAEPDNLYGRSWLVCYEATHQGWLAAPSGANAIMGDACFNFLHGRRVSFLDLTSPHPLPNRSAPATVYEEEDEYAPF